MRALGIVLIVIGVIALAVGVVYFTVAAQNLPSFMGHIAHATKHRSKRGVAAFVVGGILVIGGIVAVARARR